MECESEEEQKYGRGFYETVASDLNYKRRFIHSFKCVYMLKDYPLFKDSDFEYLGEKYRFSFPRMTFSKKRTKTVLRIYSENLMQKFSVFRAVMWDS